jgi:hypothetical protein
VYPQSDEVVGLLDCLLLGSEETLEDIGQVPNIELIMEVLGGLPEVSLHFCEQLQSTLDNWTDLLLD